MLSIDVVLGVSSWITEDSSREIRRQRGSGEDGKGPGETLRWIQYMSWWLVWTAYWW